MRDILAINLDGLLLHGTSHLGPAGHDIGVLFLNSGTLPRSARGDLCVHLADSLAEQGFKCFRVDLPGLGDSRGEVPQEYLEFYDLVQRGAYAGCVGRLAHELRRQYGLKSVVLIGLCGGAQTSVFAAAKEHGTGVAGLVLLDMPFFSYHGLNSAAQKKANFSLWSRTLTGVLRIKARVHAWALLQIWMPYAKAIYHRLKWISNRADAGRLPQDTNLLLLQALCKLLDQGIPALLITAHPPTPEPPSFDYIDYVARRAGPGLKHVKIHGTTHSFVENGGEEVVLEAVSGWLARFD